MRPPCIVRNIPRPPAETVEALAQFGVATVHEAYHRQGVLTPDFRPIVSGARICGPAVTSLNHPGDNLMLHAAIDVCQPGDVLVVTTVSPTTAGMIGELIATQCQAKGIAGLILDAGVRDVQDLRAMRFPVWARAISAVGTNKVNPGWVNVPVSCGGVPVNPGDIVLADEDGVVVVAREAAEWVIAAARDRDAQEAIARARYQAGESSLDLNNLRQVLAELGVEEVG